MDRRSVELQHAWSRLGAAPLLVLGLLFFLFGAQAEAIRVETEEECSSGFRTALVFASAIDRELSGGGDALVEELALEIAPPLPPLPLAQLPTLEVLHPAPSLGRPFSRGPPSLTA